MRQWQRASVRATFVTCAVVGLLFVASTSVFADGNGATTYTQIYHNATRTFAPPDPSAVVPCSGVPGVPATITITYNGVFHITINKAGDFWGTGTQEGDFVITPTVSGQPSYTGHFTMWFGISGNNQNSVVHSTFNIHGIGSDGSTLQFHDTAHYSVSASGVIVSFDKPICG